MVGQLTTLRAEYENLYGLSIKARYDIEEFTCQDVERLKAGDFRALKEGILALLPK